MNAGMTKRMFDQPLAGIIARLIPDELSVAWHRYVLFGLYLVGVNGGVRIWETATGKELRKCENHEAAISAVALAADGRTVASGDHANVTHLWDAPAGKHRLQVRATDNGGAPQTEQHAAPFPDGASGLHTIDVTVS